MNTSPSTRFVLPITMLASVLAIASPVVHASPPTFDEEDEDGVTVYMDMVIVEGVGWGVVDAGVLLGSSVGGDLFHFDAVFPDIEHAIVMDPRKDVRCHPDSSVNTVTSHHGFEAKHFATEAMFRAATFATSPYQKGALTGRSFEVTFADGAKAIYKILAPLGSVALEPYPTVEETGDGKLKGGPVCAEG